MGFETVILDKVEKVLKTNKAAGFFSGTLFVTCDEREANKIKKSLESATNSKIILSHIVETGEFAYDFT